MQIRFTFMPVCLVVALNGCVMAPPTPPPSVRTTLPSNQPPIVPNVNTPSVVTPPPQQAMFIAAEQEVKRLLALPNANLSQLTDYITRHQFNTAMSSYVQRVEADRQRRCNEIGSTVQHLPRSRANASALALRYGRDCAELVAAFTQETENLNRVTAPPPLPVDSSPSSATTSPSGGSGVTVTAPATPLSIEQRPLPPPVSRTNTNPSTAGGTLVVRPNPNPPAATVPTKPAPAASTPTPAPTSTPSTSGSYDGRKECPPERRFGALCNDGTRTPERGSNACAAGGGRAQWLCF